MVDGISPFEVLVDPDTGSVLYVSEINRILQVEYIPLLITAMSIRCNISGFSYPQMRKLFGSKDEAVLSTMLTSLKSKQYLRSEQQLGIESILRRVITEGVPFPDVTVESLDQFNAESMLAHFQQKHLYLPVGMYRIEAIDEFPKKWLKYASPPTLAFFKALKEGTPLFGTHFQSGYWTRYTIISVERLTTLLPGITELYEQVEFRVNKMSNPSDEEKGTVEFMKDLNESVKILTEKQSDLHMSPG